MYTLLITFFLISIVFSFLCSMWEAVLLSITPSYAQLQRQNGSRIGHDLQQFKENIDRPLAAILTLNTIAHTVGAIGVGAQATSIWGDANPIITSAVVPVVMTLGILILSEIIPKTLGANFWREFAPFTVVSLRILIRLLLPLIWISQLITKTLKKDKSASVLSRSDFMAMAELGAQEGVIDRNESNIIGNLLKFHTITAKDILTPRTVVVAASAESSIQEFYQVNDTLQFSRIPIYQKDSKDQIVGYILKDQVLAMMVEQKGTALLSSIQREITIIAESLTIIELFNQLIKQREHIALVVDDFGGTAGIVTMEDVIETLLGTEIVDEFDATEDMQHLARKNWKERARALGIWTEDASAAPSGERASDETSGKPPADSQVS